MPSNEEMAAALSGVDPWTAAAIRQRQGVQPQGGRQEGPLTHVIENYIPHAAKGLVDLPGSAIQAAGGLQRTGEYDAGPGLTAALLATGARMPFVKQGELGSGGGKLTLEKTFKLPPSLSDDAIATALSKNPGASIGDIAVPPPLKPSGMSPSQELFLPWGHVPTAQHPKLPPEVDAATLAHWRDVSPYTTPAFRGTRQPNRQVPQVGGEGQYFSTQNPDLAGMYAGPRTSYTMPQIQPLMLDTRNYLVHDAKGKSWSNPNANMAGINQASREGRPGVTIHNVFDEPGSGTQLGEPQTVHITLPGGLHTVRSKFAQFNPARYNERDLLAGIAGGAVLPPHIHEMIKALRKGNPEPKDQ